MLKGLPGSGKTTWAKAQLKAAPDKIRRVNKDDLRAMCHGRWSNEREREIVQLRNYAIGLFVGMGFDVIVDDTNFNPSHEAALREMARAANAQFEIMEFTATLEECIARDKARGAAGVGEIVIRKMHDDYFKKKE